MDKDRIAQAHSPLGPTLMFRQFTGREELSRLFHWQLELLADKDANIDPGALLGKDITVELQVKNGGKRFFNGQVTRFAFVGKEVAEETDLWRYEARLQPWLWYMTRESDFRIFQNMTVPEILDEVFKKYPFPVEKKLAGGHYRKWEYCVQYQETDFNFVSRLMEHEGIYYFFKHEMSRHTLVLVNELIKHETFPQYDTISYIPSDRVLVADEECIDQWHMAQEVRTGKFTTDDHDFETPQAELLRPRMKPFSHPHGDHLIYEWPGGYIDLEDGDNYANLRLEELQAPHETVTGEGNARGVAPGYKFTLKTSPRKDQNREYLILGVSYFVRDNPYHSGGEGPADWRMSLTAQPTLLPYRPPRITPKPLTSGPQTAVVVGPSGEEIHTDKYGRVRVLFHWDQRKSQGDRSNTPFIEDASCWMRVSHPWAGAGWGGIQIPRIGQEVIVDFIGGDPDQPIITGRVYNADQMPPYQLPDQKVVSGMKSNTHKGKGYNEFSMDDTAKKEKITVHAQYDMNTTVEHDDSQTIHNNRTISVDGTHTETIKKDTSITILEGPLKIDVQKNTFTHHVNKDVVEWFDAKQETHVFNNVEITSGNACIVLTAKEEIEFVCGASHMSLKKDGTISIVGKDISISGSDDVKVTSNKEAKMGVANQSVTCDTSKVSVAGSTINSAAIGTHEITGAMVKIN